MKYKATALKDVTIWASMPTTKIRRVGADHVTVPSSEWEWVDIAGGESVTVGLVIGIHPSCIPDRHGIRIQGVEMIQLEGYSQEDLPRDFHGLLRLDVAEE